MSNIVDNYIRENKELLHRQLLDSLELYEYEKQYAPEEVDNSKKAHAWGYYEFEEIDGVKRYYKYGEKIYPEITDDEYEQLKLIAKNKQKTEAKSGQQKKSDIRKPEYKATAKYTSGENGAAMFLKIIAWVLWIGGLIISIVSANTEVTVGSYYTYTETRFQWGIFLLLLSIYGTAGGFSMCLSTLLMNVQTIANELREFHISEEDSKK